MNYLEALEQLQLLDIEQLTLLEQAHWRYVAFMGICCPDDSHQHQAILDRQTYPQWYTHTDTGHPRVTVTVHRDGVDSTNSSGNG